MNKRIKSLILIIGIMVSGLLFSCGTTADDSNESIDDHLPFLGNSDYKKRTDAYGNTVTDTLYHTIPNFSFINQNGQEVTQDKYRGQIYIADFFFANCPTICPAKTRNLHRIQMKLDSLNLLGDVLIISHTIDPEKDSLEVLQEYIEIRDIDTEYWDFVRAEKRYTHRLASSAYLIGAEEDPEADGGFVHTDALILIDRKGHIRGVYDGTDSKDNPRMIADIQKLMKD